MRNPVVKIIFLSAWLLVDQLLKAMFGEVQRANWLSNGAHVYWLLALGGWLFLVLRHQTKPIQWSGMYVVAGAFANALDVMIWGGVRDYLPWFGFSFNLADGLIIVGVWGVLKGLLGISRR